MRDAGREPVSAGCFEIDEVRGWIGTSASARAAVDRIGANVPGRGGLRIAGSGSSVDAVDSPNCRTPGRLAIGDVVEIYRVVGGRRRIEKHAKPPA